jgi:hypothetical protein
METQLANERHVIIVNAISSFFRTINPYKKDNLHHKVFLQNLGLFVKNHLPI